MKSEKTTIWRMLFSDIARIIETNLTAPLQLTRLVIRRMLGKGLRGRIVNITSICAQRGFPGLVTYSATKGGMDAATRSLARELGGRMLVNSVAPGFFASEMSAVLGSTQLDQIVRRTPTGHLTVASSRMHSGRLLVRFEELSDRTEAEAARGTELTVAVDPEERP